MACWIGKSHLRLTFLELILSGYLYSCVFSCRLESTTWQFPNVHHPPSEGNTFVYLLLILLSSVEQLPVFGQRYGSCVIAFWFWKDKGKRPRLHKFTRHFFIHRFQIFLALCLTIRKNSLRRARKILISNQPHSPFPKTYVSNIEHSSPPPAPFFCERGDAASYRGVSECVEEGTGIQWAPMPVSWMGFSRPYRYQKPLLFF